MVSKEQEQTTAITPAPYHCGRALQSELKRRNISPAVLAKRINCSRVNIYILMQKEIIDIYMLSRLSKALHRNFVLEYAQRLNID